MMPPKWPISFLRWFCKPYYVDSIEGDLHEIYSREAKSSPSRARWHFTWNTIRFLRWRFLKDLDEFLPNTSMGMLRNYFKVSIRSIGKHRVQTLLNITGLSVGIASCILILNYVTPQLTFDRHIPDLDLIYRVTLNGSGPYTPARLVKQMCEDYPEIEAGTRVNGLFEAVIHMDQNYVVQEGGILGDSTFFDVFPTNFIQGVPENALNRPNTVVLTRSVAEKLFKSANPMGKEIRSGEDSYEVTAVVADQPETTTIPYKFIVSMPREHWVTTGWWTGNNFFSYLKLKEGVDPYALESKFHDFVRKYIAPEILRFSDQYDTFEEYLASGRSHMFRLVPMKEIHLNHPRLTLGLPGSYQNMIIFIIVGVFILIIASINYINMSTARASLRAKEIGMRKVLGSARKAVASQFIVESLIITFFSIGVGLIIALIVLPYFNLITGTGYNWQDVITWETMGWMVIIFLFVGAISGSYPALYLSSFKPLVALQGEKVGGGNKKIRIGLVVFQFAISILLISATLIVFHQVTYMSDRNLGLNAQQTFIIEEGDILGDKLQSFQSELQKHNAIGKVAYSNQLPSFFISDWNYRTIGENGITFSPYNLFVNADIKEVWELDLAEGRFFDPNLVSDSTSIVINRELARTLGWDDPLGQLLNRDDVNFRVIGMVENFAVSTAKRGVRPLLMRYSKPENMASTSGATYISVQVTGDYFEAINHFEQTWSSFVPNYPFEGYFLDDSFERLYNAERKFGNLFSGFSILAILIACIGLFALASFTIERRIKEIALRKVLGATEHQVIRMIIGEFIKFIVISALIASPLIFYLGNYWLNDYVERISLNPLHFLMPIIAVILISILTIGYQTYKAAISNPAIALKYE